MRVAHISVLTSVAKCITHYFVLMVTVAATVPLLGCGSFHTLDIRSDPPQALVLSKSSIAPNAPATAWGTTPVSTSFYFRGEDDPRQYEITVIKRGYEPARTQVDFKSPKTMDVALQRIPDVNDSLFDTKTLPDRQLLLLPVTIQVNHVNDLSGKELTPDPEASKVASEFLMSALPKLRPGTKRLILSSPAQDDWISTEPDLKGFLDRIDTHALRYEPRPIMAEREVKGFGTLRTALPAEADTLLRGPLLVYISGVCYVATSEYMVKRAAVQGLATILGMVGGALLRMSHGSRPAVGGSRPSGGSERTGRTDLRLSILDIKTSEVLHVDALTLGDCTKPESFEAELEEVAQRLGANGTTPQ